MKDRATTSKYAHPNRMKRKSHPEEEEKNKWKHTKKKITLLLLFKNEYARAGIICVHVKYQDTLLLFISSFFFYFFFNYVCFPFLFLCVCNV